MQEKNKISRERRKFLINQLKTYMTPKKKELYLSAFFSYLQFLMRVISFAFIALVFSRLYASESVNFIQTGLLLALFSALGYVFSLLGKKYQGIPSQYARESLKREFFQAFLKKEGEFEEKSTWSDILLVASQGIDSLDTYYSHYLSLDLRTKLNCVTIFVLLLWIYPLGALFFAFFLPFIPVSIILSQKRSQKIMNRYWGSYSDVGNLFMDNLKGLNTLDSYQVTAKYHENFVKKAEDFRDATMELLAFQLKAVAYMDSIMYIAISFAGIFAVKQYFNELLPLSSFIFFIFIATEFFAPLREQGYGMHLLMMNAKMADKIFTFLDTIKEDEAKSTKNLKPFKACRLENLSFAFEQDYPLLEQLSLTLEQGKLYVLAGESGLGKSTLARLITGSLKVQEGRIFFDEQDSQAFTKTDILKEVLYLSPRSTLLNQSIYENLCLASNKTKEEVLAFIEEKQVLQFVKDLPEGLDTVVGEKGRLLSPGQVQQILCLRAFFAEKSFYILDEVSSSVDKDHEEAIYRLIDLLCEKHIVLEITHKMKRVEAADQVLFLSKNLGKTKLTLASPTELKSHSPEYLALLETQKALEESIYGK